MLAFDAWLLIHDLQRESTFWCYWQQNRVLYKPQLTSQNIWRPILSSFAGYCLLCSEQN